MKEHAFAGVDIKYVPGTPIEQRYAADQTRAFGEYIQSIVSVPSMQRLLHPDFVQIDGACHMSSAEIPSDEAPPVSNLMVNRGKEPFISVFRHMVNSQIVAAPGIPVTGVWIDPEAFELVSDEITDMTDVEIPGKRLAVAAIEFPYVLRSREDGGQPLDFPEPFKQALGIDPAETIFEPLSATGNVALDRFTLRVIQDVIVDDDGLVTGRRGIVWGALNDTTVRSAPEEIAREIEANRRGEVYPALSALAVALQIEFY